MRYIVSDIHGEYELFVRLLKHISFSEEDEMYICGDVTAYVWILFELEDDDYSFKPEKSVAFFEHANLANKGTYKFLKETLIDKSLKHFESIYAQPENSERRYRFVCAMNDKIALECINKYRDVMNSGTPIGEILKEKIVMEPKHSPSDVFASYDEFSRQAIC